MGGTQFLQSESAPGRTYDPVLVQMLYHRATGHSWEHKAIKLYTVEPLQRSPWVQKKVAIVGR